MEEGAATFDDFSVEMGEYEIVKKGEFDRIWKIEYGGSISGSPSLYKNIVYFGCANHFVYAVDSENGKLVWKFSTGGSPSPLPPSYEQFEMQMKLPEQPENEEKKAYDLTFEREDELNTSEYLSRVTYQISTQYSSKGKYQIDSHEEDF